MIRSNTFSRGPALGVTGNSSPDMGTSVDPGLNDLTMISGTVIRHDGLGTVTAIGNDWPNEPPVAGDIVITNTGSVVTEW